MIRIGSFGLSRRCGGEPDKIGTTPDLPDRPNHLSETKSSHIEIFHCGSEVARGRGLPSIDVRAYVRAAHPRLDILTLAGS